MGAASFGDIYWSSDILLSEEEKNSFEFLSSKIDHYIQQYVYTKKHITKARNMYEGRRDIEDFNHITTAYGLQNALDLEFTPIIKPRVDILIGEMLRETFRYTVTCLDKNTINKIENEKEKERLKALLDYAQMQLQQMGETPPIYAQKAVEDIYKKYGDSYKSNYVKGVYFLMEFFRSDNRFDLKQKLKQYFLDLLLTGEAYYRVKPGPGLVDPELEIIKPENMYYNKNTNSQYLDTTDCIVHRELYTRQQVLEKFGYMLSEDDLKNLFSSWSEVKQQNYPQYSRADVRTLDAIGDLRGSYFTQWSFNPYETVEVYHVEFLSHNKVEDEEVTAGDFNIEPISNENYAFPQANGMTTGDGGVDGEKWKWREDRYEGYRIGQNVYFGMGKTIEVHRSQDNPYKAGFSYDGITYNDRNGEPYSLGLALAPIQDKYDLLMYFRDNLIANSGVKGSRVNLAAIPKVFGKDFNERMSKFISYRKQGVEFIDPTEAGAELFQHYGDFDNSIDGNGLKAIGEVLGSLEAQADILTGVNRQMYGNIEEKDAVTNVKVGIERSSLMVKDYFELLKVSRERIFNRMIQTAQVLYKKGKRGAYILGSNQITFEVVAKDFVHSDYGINVTMDGEDAMRVERVQRVAEELASAGLIEPQVLLKIVTHDNIVDMMDELEDSIFKQKQENSQLAQLQQQVEQTTEQLNQIQKELSSSQKQNQSYVKQNYDLEERKVKVLEQKGEDDSIDQSITRYNTSEKDRKELGLKRALLQLEKAELQLAVIQGGNGEEFNMGNRKEVNNESVGL